MKIAIYEPIHLDWIIPLCDFFSQRQDEVFFFAAATFENDLVMALQNRCQQFSFTYADEAEDRSVFRQKLHAFFQSQHFDLILLNSVDARHLFLYEAVRKNKAKVVINIHDVHNFFKPSLSLHLRQLLRTVGKKALARRADAYIVNADAMREYIVTKKLTIRPVFWIPPVISYAKRPLTEDPVFSITVPGSIHEKRRDYRLVLTVFAQLANAFGQNVQITLAGRPVGEYGAMIIKEAKTLQKQGIRIRFFEDEVPENEFQEIIGQSTLLWSPLCRSTAIHDNINETYGLTKVSGNMYDAIRHGKPLLVPEGLQVPEEIISSCLFYQNEEAAEKLLRSLLNNENERRELAAKAFRNAQRFSLANGLSKLENMLTAVVSRTVKAQHEYLPRK